MKKYFRIFFVSAIITVLLISCVKDEDLEIADPNAIAAENVYSSGKAAIQALNGAYAPLAEVNLWGQEMHFFLSQASGEFSLKWTGDVNWNQFADLTLLSENNNSVKGFWISFYNVINRANDVLHNIDKLPSGELSEERIEQAKGEAYFLRGLSYTYLIMMYSDYYPEKNMDGRAVPIITKNASSREGMFVPRSSVEAVLNQIISDLDQAADLLPESWSDASKGRAIKYGAIGMKGRLFHFLGMYDEAIVAFEEIINNSQHHLVSNFRSLFDGSNENNEESLFEIQYSLPDISNLNAYSYGPGPTYPWTHGNTAISGWENVDIPDESGMLLDGDPRQGATMFIEGDSVKPGSTWNAYPFSSKGYMPKKWLRVDESARFGAGSIEFTGQINMTILRLADIYLMYSEALIKTNGDEGVAREYINKVRRRAYQVDVNTSSEHDIPASTSNFMDVIKEERYIEFFGEGIRWFDLIRWGDGPDFLSDKGFSQGIHERLPIPIQEIELNEAMQGQQNDGY